MLVQQVVQLQHPFSMERHISYHGVHMFMQELLQRIGKEVLLSQTKVMVLKFWECPMHQSIFKTLLFSRKDPKLD